MQEKRSNFGSKLGVVLAAAGSAVGLGNVWRFPAEVGSNGGAAFILVYLACVLLIGVPVMVSEFLIGRHTHANTITAFSRLAPRQWWRIGGVEGVFVAFLILSYYVVVSGWTLHYTVASVSRTLPADPGHFMQFVSHPWWPVVYAVAFMVMVHLIIMRGVQSGIERFSKVMMPMLLLIIGVLVVCSFSMSGSRQGLEFLLSPDFSKITPNVVLSAMGQAFFSLSLAMGCLCTYASYFGPKTQLLRTAVNVSIIDTMVAILSGFIIFPAVFSVPGVEVNEGPGLVFMTLPSVFEQAFSGAPWLGYIFSGLFYLLLLLAALTSAISLHEPVTAFLSETTRLTRTQAALVVSVSCMALGVLCSLSWGPLSQYTLMGMNLFDLFDFLSAKIIMPLGGLIIVLFVGWRLDRRLVESELTNQGTLRIPLLGALLFVLRYFVPLAIVLIFCNELLQWLLSAHPQWAESLGLQFLL